MTVTPMPSNRIPDYHLVQTVWSVQFDSPAPYITGSTSSGEATVQPTMARISTRGDEGYLIELAGYKVRKDGSLGSTHAVVQVVTYDNTVWPHRAPEWLMGVLDMVTQ